jgi:hypothetical protein
VNKRRWCFFIAIAAVVAVAIVSVLGKCTKGCRRITDLAAVAAAEDEVYEAVVRNVYIPDKKNAAVTQLVFSRTFDTNLCPGVDRKTCLDGVRQRLKGAADGNIRAETIDSFVRQSQVSGNLSTTFRTELPRTFIDPDSLYFVPSESKVSSPFTNRSRNQRTHFFFTCWFRFDSPRSHRFNFHSLRWFERDWTALRS